MLRLGDRLVNGFSQLLNEFSQICVQVSLRFSPAREGVKRNHIVLTLLLMISKGNGNQPAAKLFLWSRTRSAVNLESVSASRPRSCWIGPRKPALRLLLRISRQPRIHPQCTPRRARLSRVGHANSARLCGALSHMPAVSCGSRSLDSSLLSSHWSSLQTLTSSARTGAQGHLIPAF